MLWERLSGFGNFVLAAISVAAISGGGYLVWGLLALAIHTHPNIKQEDPEERARYLALSTKEFEQGLKPELAGKYFIVGENTRLVQDPTLAASSDYIKAGSCVRALRVSTTLIEFDVKVAAKFGATRDTTRVAPGGKCAPTADPIGTWH